MKLSTGGRLSQLDVLRGVAILLVLGHHCAALPEQAGTLRPVAMLWHRLGWTGVDLFFVLSGYLIGGLLLTEVRASGRLAVGRFLARRAFKIWPGFFAYLAFISLTMAWGFGDEAPEVRRVGTPMLARFVLALQNYIGPISGRTSHTWSLAVEEHFYLALPLLLVVLPRRAIPVLALAAAVGCTTWRWTANAHRLFDPLTHEFPTHLRADSLAWGVLLAYLTTFHQDTVDRLAQRPVLLAITGLALIAPMASLDLFTCPFVSTFGYTFLYLGYGCLLMAALRSRVSTGQVGRLLAAIGFYSYSIYLWHIEVLRFVQQTTRATGSASEWCYVTALYVLGAAMVGVLMCRCIEQPALALRDRLVPPRSKLISISNIRLCHPGPCLGTLPPPPRRGL